MQQLLASGKVAYAYIGITTQDVTPGLARRFDLGAERGALVAEVQDGTPAAAPAFAAAGAQEFNGLDITLGGDLIVAIAGEPVRASEDVSRIVTDRLLPGQTVSVTVVRDGSSARTSRCGSASGLCAPRPDARWFSLRLLGAQPA